MIYIEHLKDKMIIRLRAQDEEMVGHHETVLSPGMSFGPLTYDEIRKKGEGAIDSRVFNMKEEQ